MVALAYINKYIKYDVYYIMWLQSKIIHSTLRAIYLKCQRLDMWQGKGKSLFSQVQNHNWLTLCNSSCCAVNLSIKGSSYWNTLCTGLQSLFSIQWFISENIVSQSQTFCIGGTTQRGKPVKWLVCFNSMKVIHVIHIWLEIWNIFASKQTSVGCGRSNCSVRGFFKI